MICANMDAGRVDFRNDNRMFGIKDEDRFFHDLGSGIQETFTIKEGIAIEPLQADIKQIEG
jgi:hypothetical protein